jgi:hypothetical protein
MPSSRPRPTPFNNEPSSGARRMENGAWLTSYPSYMNGTELSADEFQDNLRLQFSLPPLNLTSHCDRCGQHFSMNHGLQCKKGGSAHLRQDDVADEWVGLCQQALTAAAVSSEPFIYAGRGHTLGRRRHWTRTLPVRPP